MKSKFTVIIATLFLSAFAFADIPFAELAEKFRAYSYNSFEEKVYVHFDKPYYTVGETIWFKATAVEGINLTPDTISVPL